jgi:hypothetical protein
VAKRALRIHCTEPGCSAQLDPSSIAWHMALHEDREK